MPNTLRLKMSGLHDAGRVLALKRSFGLVADIQEVFVDAGRGEVVVSGDTDEHLMLIHLVNEGFEVYPVHEVPLPHLP